MQYVIYFGLDVKMILMLHMHMDGMQL